MTVTVKIKESDARDDTRDCKTLQAIELAWAEDKRVRAEDLYRLIGMESKVTR